MRPRSDSFPVPNQSSDGENFFLPSEKGHRIRHKSWILSPGLPMISNETGRTSNCHIRRRFLIKDKTNLPPIPPKKSFEN